MAQPFSSVSARVLPFALGAALFVSACSSSSEDGSGGGDGTPAAVVQNLTVDPNGRTVTVDVTGARGTITSASVEASGGQMAVSVVRTGSSIAVGFDQRVTPDHQVRLLGVPGVNSGWRDVTTSDSRVPQLTVLSATQDTSDDELGGDTIQVAFYSGPRVVESQVTDLDSWKITVGGLIMNLTGSVIDFDPATQVAELTLGPLANLHQDFTVRVEAESVAAVAVNPAAVGGIATGDTTPPALEGSSPVTQNLVVSASGDEYGRVVEFTFNEPISPVFGAQPYNFSVVDHPAAVGMTSITRAAVVPGSDSTVRVHFSRPVVPGLDQIEIDGVVDAHGNAFPAQSVPIAAGSTVANSFQSVDFITEEGLENDAVVAVLAQALDPDTAALSDRWTLDVGGVGPVDLSTQEISYDLLTKTIRIDLDFDVVNGTTADLASVGGMDIDGEGFTVAAAQVSAAGDSSAPQLQGITQNREVDIDGRTVDVRFTEDLDVMTATNVGNYTFSPAIVVQGAMLVDGSLVRLELADVAIPGDVVLTISQAVSDPAGNDLGSVVGPGTLTSTDQTPPSPIVAAARAIEGQNNDTVTVLFNDQLIQSEAEDVNHWTLESPVGNAVDLSQATITYDAGIRVATILLGGPNGFPLLNTDDFQVSVTTMRDLGGNTVQATPINGSIIAEGQRPALEAAYAVPAGIGEFVTIRFSEPMRNLEDLYDASSNPAGVRYGQVDSVTSVETFPVAATSLDGGLGVLIEYASPIDPSGTLNVVGLTDLAGNLLFPVLGLPIATQQNAPPAQSSAPALTADSGVDNDSLLVQFSTPMSGWRLLEPSQYTLRETGSGTVIDLSQARFTRIGLDAVQVELRGPTLPEFDASLTYDLELNVDPNDPLRTEHGVAIGAPDLAASVSVSGDVTQGPTQVGSLALIDPTDANSAIVVFSETVDMLSALDAAGYTFNGSTALSISEYSARAVRATFNVPVTLGGTLEIQNTAAVDSAGNPAGGLISLAVTQDTTAPSIAGVSASVAPGFGGDQVVLTFDEELDPAQATDRFRYTLMAGGQTLRIASALYSSNDFSVTLACEDLEDGATIEASVNGVGDLSGNVPVGALSDSAMATGDSDAPQIATAYVNLAANASGRVIDVLFSESIDTSFVDDSYRWSTNAFSSVLGVEVLAPDHVQVLVDVPLLSSDELILAPGLEDPAGNQAPELSVDPIE
ncbi:hypothetical protein Poly30_33190 [Planctomycetes bacterium Poly30]|uniref:SbsA Ig-like domain-containing protein n=1 Tax=Saltatorellus ferox TaxID=2528018 RepID=A0A518EUL4_9BACT|nr:hypothetical protein Poly30_33190 [Planctomycetes bacterium Poly30]